MTPMEQEGYLPEYERGAFEAAERAYEESVEKRITKMFYGDEPACVPNDAVSKMPAEGLTAEGERMKGHDQRNREDYYEPEKALSDFKYLNAECGLSGCQWLVAQHQVDVYRARMAAAESESRTDIALMRVHVGQARVMLCQLTMLRLDGAPEHVVSEQLRMIASELDKAFEVESP